MDRSVSDAPTDAPSQEAYGLETTILLESEPVAVIDWTCPGGPRRVVRHSGTGHALAISREGVYRKWSEGRAVTGVPGTVVFFPRRPVEYVASHPVGGGDAGTVLRFGDAALAAWARELGIPDAKLGDLAHGTMPTDAMARLARLRDLLVEVDDPGMVEVEELALSLVAEAFEAIFDTTGPPPLDETTERARWEAVERARLCVQKRYAEPLRLADIACEAGYSPFHLTRVFKAIEGITVHRYLNRVRLLAGLEELRRGGEVGTIAHRVGFCAHSHFTTAFRKEFGVPPSSLRPPQED